MRLFFSCFLSLLAHTAMAEPVCIGPEGAGLEAQALNGTEAARTVEASPGKRYTKANVFVYLTQDSATAITVTPYCKKENDEDFARYTSRAISSGTGTLSLYSDSLTVSADTDFFVEYDIRNCERVKYVIGSTSGGASDLVDVSVCFTGDQ